MNLSSCCSFADADSSEDDADIIIVGVPFDTTASFRHGAKFAPNAIRDVSGYQESYVFYHDCDMTNIKIHDAGNIDEMVHPDEMLADVEHYASGILLKNAFPIFIGGDHSITPGIVRAMHKKYGDDFGVIAIDAHMDFRDEYLEEKNSHACVTRRISDIIGVENVMPIGVRSCSKEEMEEARQLGLKFISAFDIRKNGIDAAISEALTSLNKSHLYLTFDIDGLDPAYAPATGTPEPFGITDFDALKIIDAVAKKLIGFDIVEVCPPYDNGNTASLAATFIKEVICATQKNKY